MSFFRKDKNPMIIRYSTVIMFDDDTSLFNCYVMRENSKTTLRTLLDVGTENSEENAITWGSLAIEARGWLDKNESPPDYYTRTGGMRMGLKLIE